MSKFHHLARIPAFAGVAALVGAAALALPSNPASAEMFSGKTVRVLIGYAAGGGYDRYGRQVARHIGKYLPGKPNVVAVNMPGAGSYKVVNYIYNTAPKDGTEFAIFARSVPILAFSGKFDKTRFDPLKLTWIGTSSSYKGEAYLVVVRKDTGVKNIEDLRKIKKTVMFSATAFGSDGTDVPIVLREVLGLNVQALRGYPGGNSLYLAVDRGETQGRMVGYASVKTAHPEWLKPDSPINVVLQFATRERLPAFPNAPTAYELARNDADRALIDMLEAPFYMARPFAGPPGMPAANTSAVRAAFMAAHEDPVYKKEAKKLRLLTSPQDGATVQNLVAKLGKMSPDLYARYTRILKNPDSPVRVIKWVKFSGKISKTGKKGRFVVKTAEGKSHKLRARGSYTKIKINGKKAKSKALKKGMECNVWWEGPKTTPGRVECTK
jgi:tripartite-type tricarboxylate transporter receptor subunit TctC